MAPRKKQVKAKPFCSKLYLIFLIISVLLIGFLTYLNYEKKTHLPKNSPVVNDFQSKKDLVVKKWSEFNSLSNKEMLQSLAFTMDYPSDWTVNVYSIEFSNHIEFSKDKEKRITPITVDISGGNSVFTLEQCVNQYYCGDEKKICPDVKLAKDLKINGMAAKEVTSADKVYKTIYIKKGATLVSIHIYLLANNNSNYTDSSLLSVFNHIASSIKIK